MCGGVEHVDTIDPLSGFERDKLLDRAAQRFGHPRHLMGCLHDAIVKAAQRVDQAGTKPIVYPALTGAELDGEEYSVEYLIPGILAAGQHAIGGGPHKSLKTLVLGCDLGLSLAIGGHFLGYFAVPRPVRTCIMSGECGFPVMQDNLRRVARAAGTDLRSVGNLLITETLPKFGHLDHVEAMGRFLQDNEIQVCIIDPVYLCFDGADAGNVFIMGGLLRSMAEVFVAHTATMILLHHTTKPAGIDGQPIELTELSFAGFREFAAQWFLLSRRRRYEPGTGHHELWLSIGGRAGHSGLWGLDVDEGEYRQEVERRWEVSVLTAEEARSGARERDHMTKERDREARQQAQLEADKQRIVRIMAKYPAGASRSFIRDAVGMNSNRVRQALASLLDEGAMEQCGIVTGNRKQPQEGYRLVLG